MKYLKSIASLFSGVAGLGIQGTAMAASMDYATEYLGASVSVIDMNDNGEIIGREGGALFRWSFDDQGILNKEPLPIAQFDAFDINNRSEILTKTGLYNTSTKSLVQYAGGNIAYGGYVNDLGEIVLGAGVRFLPEPSANEVRIASGKIVPAAFNNNGLAVDSQGAIWDVHTGQKVGSKPVGIGSTYVANDMNDKNQILYSTASGGDSYVYNLDGGQINLGIYGYDLDNAGNVVGWDFGVNGSSAVIWMAETNTAYDLNAYLSGGLQLKSATHINDKGWIVAEGVAGGSYLLKPVPLPSSGILLFSSLLGFFALVRARINRLRRSN